MNNPFGTKNLMRGMGIQAAPAPVGGLKVSGPQPKAAGLSSLLGNPAFMAGLSLLGAGQDSRINAPQAALGGLMGAGQFQSQQDQMGLKRRESEAKIGRWDAETEKAKEQAKYRQQYEAAVAAGEKPDAILAYRAGIPVDAWKAQYGQKDRKSVQDASGRHRYMDTGEFVFNDGSAVPRDPEKVYTQEKGLRGEFQDLNKEYRKQEDAFGRIIASAQDPSAAGDLALIFNYMKVLDPGSTVREGEFANAENSGGVGAKVYNMYNKVMTGERLTPQMRADFVTRGAKLYEESKRGFGAKADQYRGLSGQYNVDPNRVVSSGPLYQEEDYSNYTVSDRKQMGGKNYIQINGEWFEDD